MNENPSTLMIGRCVRRVDDQRRMSIPSMFMVRARRELYVHLSKYVGTAYAMWKPAFVFPKFEEPVFKVGVRPGHTGDEMLLMANTFRCPVHGKSRIVLPSEIFAELGYPESLECLGAGEAFYMFKLGTSPLTRH